MRQLSFLAVVLALAIPVAAHADTYSYTYSWPTYTDSFVLTSPGLITSSTTLATTSCLFNGIACSSVKVDPVTAMGFTFYDSSSAELGSDTGFDPSFFTVGVHTFDDISLSIEPVGVTPEPSSLVLLGTGLLGAFGAARKRFFKA